MMNNRKRKMRKPATENEGESDHNETLVDGPSKRYNTRLSSGKLPPKKAATSTSTEESSTESETESESDYSETAETEQVKRYYARRLKGKQVAKTKLKKTFVPDFPVEPLPVLPREVIEAIFKNLSRDSLDRCQRVCRSWYHTIKDAGNALPQLRTITNMEFIKGDLDDTLEMESDTGRKARIDQRFVRARPTCRVFENSIIPQQHDLISYATLEEYKRINQLAGSRIPIRDYSCYVDSMPLYQKCRNIITDLIKTPKITIEMSQHVFMTIAKRYASKKREDYLDFGPDMPIEFQTRFYRFNYQENAIKRFYGCQGLKHPDLISLTLNVLEQHDEHFNLIITAFREASALKFFKVLTFNVSSIMLEHFLHSRRAMDELNLIAGRLPSRHNFKLVGEIKSDTTTKRVYTLEHPSHKCMLKLTVDQLKLELKLERTGKKKK